MSNISNSDCARCVDLAKDWISADDKSRIRVKQNINHFKTTFESSHVLLHFKSAHIVQQPSPGKRDNTEYKIMKWLKIASGSRVDRGRSFWFQRAVIPFIILVAWASLTLCMHGLFLHVFF